MTIAIKKETYIRNAKISRIIDGDTIVLDVDLGCSTFVNMTARLEGINAPEKNTPEGLIAKKYLEDKMPAGTPVVVQTTKDKKEKYGRYLATVYLNKETVSLNDQLIKQQQAVAYDGGKRI